MVKRSKGRNKALSNPVTSFLNGATTLGTTTATKMRNFAANIVTSAAQFLKASPVAADDPLAGRSLWSFLRRFTTSAPRVQAKHDGPPTPTPAEPATSFVAQHLAPVPVAQPSLPPRIETPARVRYSSDGPAEWTDRDNTDIKIDSNGKYLSKRKVPPRICQRIDRYKELSNLFDIWLIEFARYYGYWGLQYCLKADKIHIKIDSYKDLAETLAHRVNGDIAVRRHVQEIVELRCFVNRWFEDVIWRKHLPATCGIAEEARSHLPPYEAMVAVLDIFGGCIDHTSTSST
ncbi:hypothetical protein LTR17_016667 [Elasticomyces elasticus]|nr:hypothetical protein LTR17_016667 [Elasticomyces elasticus]